MVVDVYGMNHKHYTILNKLSRTVVICDTDDATTYLVHKSDLGMEVPERTLHEVHMNKEGFDLKASQALKLNHEETLKRVLPRLEYPNRIFK